MTPKQAPKSLADALVANGTIKPGQKPTVDAVLDAWDDPEVRAAITACAGGQQAFNLHDLIFTPAYAAGCGSMVIGGRSVNLSKEGAQAVLCVTGAAAGGIAGKSLGIALRAASGPIGAAIQEALKSDPTEGEFTKSFNAGDGMFVTVHGYGGDLYSTMTVDAGPASTSYILQKQGNDLVVIGAAVNTPDGSKRPLTDAEFAIVVSSQAQALAGAGIIIPNKASDTGKQIPKPGISGKEGAKDVPSWAKGERPNIGQDGKDFAKKLMDDKYGPGNWDQGPKSEYNKLRKWADRAFIDPVKK